MLLNFWQAQCIITRKKQHRGENNTTTPDRLSQNTEQGLALKEKKITQQYVGCYERLFKTRFKQVLSNHSTHETQRPTFIFLMENPWAKVKGKTIVVGDRGGNSLQLGSDWLHSLHLHLGQITQYGLPTTVCMTNDRDRANLQPTQPHTFTCNRKKKVPIFL